MDDGKIRPQKRRTSPNKKERKQMAFKVILFVLALLAPIVIFAMAKSFCDWWDEQEKRKEAAKWSR